MAIYAKGSDGIRRLVAGNSDGDMALMSPRHYVGEATIPTRATDVLAPSWEGKSTVTGTPSPNNPATITGVSFAATAISPDGQTRSVDFGFTGYSLPDGVRDTYDGVRGDFVQRVGKLVLDGTENWKAEQSQYYLEFKGINPYVPQLCTHFVYSNTELVLTTPGYFVANIYNNLVIQYDGGSGGVDNFKSWLTAQAIAGTPVTIYYELAQPIAYNRKVDITAFDGRTTVTGADAVDVLEGRVLRVADCLPFEIVQSNTNLLPNWYFANPINQREKTAYEGPGPIFDRYRTYASDARVTLSLDGVHISSKTNPRMYCLMDDLSKYRKNTVFTFSVLCNNKVEKITFDLLHTTEKTNDTISIAFNHKDLPYPGFLIGTMLNYPIAAAKLEKGTEQTLARKIGDQWVLNDPPPDPTLELLKCQRYQCVIPFGVGQPISNVIVDGNGSAYFPIYLPVQMRLDIAKIEIQGNLRTHIASGGYCNCELDSTASLQGNICNLRAYGLETNTACGLDSDTGGKIIVDENL